MTGVQTCALSDLLGLVFGAVTLINPSMTGLSVGVPAPASESVMVIPFDVLPDEPNTFSYPPGGVTVELPAGTVNQPTEFLYTFLDVASVPARLEGFTLTDRVFDLSLVGTEGPVTLGRPITVKVRIDTGDVALAKGDESRVLIQHYHQEEGWEVLETSVDFTSSVASARVERLSVFALTIREPETPPALASVATAIPSPTAVPSPPPTLMATPTVVTLPTATPITSPIPAPTSTPLPVPTAVPVIVPTVVVQQIGRAHV